jgi:hypothetical protein
VQSDKLGGPTSARPSDVDDDLAVAIPAVVLEVSDTNVNGCWPHADLGQDLPRESHITEACPAMLPEIAAFRAGEKLHELAPPGMTGQDQVSD